MQRLVGIIGFFAALTLAGCAPDLPERPRHHTAPPAPEAAAPAAIPQPAPPMPSGTVKVALLLPLSNESAALGNAMLDAAMLALYDKYISLPPDQIHTKIVLVPKDTGATPKDAEVAATQAMSQGVQMILGPVFGPDAQAVAAIAKSRNVPVISFSNNRGIAGWPLFVFGYLPDQQVARLADYSFGHNVKQIAALAPNDVYGQAVTQALSASYRAKGGNVQPIEFYSTNADNLNAAMSRLGNAYKTMPYEGLFIAEGADRLSAILPPLRNQPIDRTKVKLLGLGVWDDPATLKYQDMQGSWLVSGSPQHYQWFERRFEATYGYKPKRIASLAYDAVALAVELANSPKGINQASLTSGSGFIGPANGLFRLRADGTAERGLAVLEVSGDGFKTIDPAPLSFGAAPQ